MICSDSERFTRIGAARGVPRRRAGNFPAKIHWHSRVKRGIAGLAMMMTMLWTKAGPAIMAAFLASLVEAVEAFTIIIVVGTITGWRPALLGTLGGLIVLALIVVGLGPLLALVPLQSLQLIIGILLLLFGTRWLRKAILRAAGIVPLHDEDAVFAKMTLELEEEAQQKRTRLNWLAGTAAFKAVLLEGLEVVFIVIAVGAGGALLIPAAIGAGAAFLLVLLAGLIVHKPLARVPENVLKFGVGVILSAFGVFWTGEGLGIHWPGEDLAIVVFAGLFLGVAFSLVAGLRSGVAESAE